MVVIFRTLLVAVVAVGMATPAHAGEFEYSIPPGWVDLLAANPDMSRIPKDMLAEATSGRFKAYAADPVENAAYPAMFKAVEQPGTVVITLGEVNTAAAEMIQALAASGIRATIDEYSVFKLNGVPVGMLTIDLGGTGNTRVIRQYLIPGRKTATVLSYSIPKYEYTRYLPAIEASARATRGAYDNGGYSWKRGLTAAGTGGLVGAIFYIAFVLNRKRRAAAARRAAMESGEGAADATPRAGAPAAQRTSKHVWTCPGCGNPVPMRLAQCRCGAAKPT
jgi:predicted RNA-binding Zn-ribbon protein involved in translation (DUF1610 family)